MDTSPKERTKLEVMKEFNLTDVDYKEFEKRIEKTSYYNHRLLYHSAVALWVSIKDALRGK